MIDSTIAHRGVAAARRRCGSGPETASAGDESPKIACYTRLDARAPCPGLDRPRRKRIPAASGPRAWPSHRRRHRPPARAAALTDQQRHLHGRTRDRRCRWCPAPVAVGPAGRVDGARSVAGRGSRGEGRGFGPGGGRCRRRRLLRRRRHRDARRPPAPARARRGRGAQPEAALRGAAAPVRSRPSRAGSRSRAAAAAGDRGDRRASPRKSAATCATQVAFVGEAVLRVRRRRAPSADGALEGRLARSASASAPTRCRSSR